MHPKMDDVMKQPILNEYRSVYTDWGVFYKWSLNGWFHETIYFKWRSIYTIVGRGAFKLYSSAVYTPSSDISFG